MSQSATLQTQSIPLPREIASLFSGGDAMKALTAIGAGLDKAMHGVAKAPKLAKPTDIFRRDSAIDVEEETAKDSADNEDEGIFIEDPQSPISDGCKDELFPENEIPLDNISVGTDEEHDVKDAKAVVYYKSSVGGQAIVRSRDLKSTIDEPASTASPISIKTHDDIVVCVIGVGYVGEHLLSGFGSVFNAIGFDVSEKRIEHITPDFADFSKVKLTTDVSQLARATHYLISVPTNLHKDKSVNASHLQSAISMVAQYARPGATVVIESSVSVGMTRALLGKYCDKLYCGMSPERVDPGRTSPSLIEIPKVISGLNDASMAKIYEVYSQVFNKVVPVSRCEVAEMTKLYENCYRMINIAYVNEIADACAVHGIDPNEVIDAASTKPFGFQPFRPGLGVGGHCIPINPYYLFVNNDLPVLEHAASRMHDRPGKLARELHVQHSFGKSSLRVLVVGVAFKPGQSVISCSPGLSFASAMNDAGCETLMYYDPLVPQSDAPWITRMADDQFSRKYIDTNFDLVCVCMKQKGVDLDVLDTLRSAHVKYF